MQIKTITFIFKSRFTFKPLKQWSFIQEERNKLILNAIPLEKLKPVDMKELEEILKAHEENKKKFYAY